MTITQSPTYPVAGEAVTLTSNASAVMVADYAIELTSVPSSSTLSTGLQLIETTASVTNPLQAVELGLLADGFTPDVAGEYGVTVYVIQQRLPSAPGDRTIRYAIAATESGTVNVAVDMDLPIQTVSYGGATLRLRVVGSTIRAASLRDFSGDAARAASLQSTVTSALSAIVDVAVSTAIGDPYTRTNDLLSNFTAHLANASTAHNVADTTNTLTEEAGYSVAGMIRVLNKLRTSARGHAYDGDAGSRWHGGEDTLNTTITGDAVDLATATVLLSDLRERFYERHRVMNTGSTPPVHNHGTGDTTNTLSAPTKLDDVIVAYLDALVDESPTAATGEVDGAIVAANAAGFRIVT